MIPRIIHYCWLSNDPIPEKLQMCMKSWKEKLPGYEFKLWNFSCFDINSSQWVKQAFEAKKYAFAADYIRLFAVYHFGGIYMDMDVEVIRSFDELLNRDYILGYEAAKGIEAGVFGASKESLWVKKCLDYYENRSFILSDGRYNDTPLPIIMENCIKKDFIDTGVLSIFSPDYLTAKSYKTGKIVITSNTYTIHHFAGSWKSSKEKCIVLIARFIGPYFTHILGNIRRFINRKKS